MATGAPGGHVDCRPPDDTTHHDYGYIGDLILSRDGQTVYAVDQINFPLVIADTRSKQITHGVPDRSCANFRDASMKSPFASSLRAPHLL